MPDVDHLVFGHGQGEGGHIAPAENLGDTGPHALQEVGEVDVNPWTHYSPKMYCENKLLAHLVDNYKVFRVCLYFAAPNELRVWIDTWRPRLQRKRKTERLCVYMT